MGVLGLQERVRSRLFLRRDKYSRFISALVYLPRERFNTDVRLRIEAMLKDALHGEYVDSSVVLGESPLAQVHLIVRPKPGEMLDVDTAELEQKLAQVLRNWQDDLREALVATARPKACASPPVSARRCRRLHRRQQHRGCRQRCQPARRPDRPGRPAPEPAGRAAAVMACA